MEVKGGMRGRNRGRKIVDRGREGIRRGGMRCMVIRKGRPNIVRISEAVQTARIEILNIQGRYTSGEDGFPLNVLRYIAFTIIKRKKKENH